MVMIREVVHHALTKGYLSRADEEHLRQLLQTKYDPEDFWAFMQLQAAFAEGQIQQESRQQIGLSSGSAVS